MAGGLALKDAAEQTHVVLLEPVDELAVLVDDDFVGAVMGDFSSRRGHVVGTEPVGNGRTLVRASVPQLEIVRYAIDLRSLSHGTGTFTRSYNGTPHASERRQQARLVRNRRRWPGCPHGSTAVRQRLRQHLGLRHNRHEIGVTTPAWHHVLVQVRKRCQRRQPFPGSTRH